MRVDAHRYDSAPPGQRRPRPDAESFYRLTADDVPRSACAGLACFVARHRDPVKWARASTGHPRVYCLGKCFAAPATGEDDPKPSIKADARHAVVLRRLVDGGASSLDAYRRTGGYAGLEKALRCSPDEVIRTVEASGLRGRGGAAFPTGQKLRLAYRQSRRPKYVVVNADEGDPGAYVDRFLLEGDPHAVLEGMLIAAYAVGASEGWVYLRCEYPAAKPVIERALSECRAAGILGPRILGSGFSFDVSLVVGRGSYVCGEETALLNAIEGARPVAQSRPPYTAEAGLFGRPTVVNNVETLANVPWILEHGAGAFHDLGFSDSRGTKVVSLNSLFNRPGLYEVEFGATLRRIIEELGGGLRSGAIRGVIVGGPLAGIIPPHLFDTPLGFEELHAIAASVGHGGIVAFDEHTSIAELVRHVFSFAAYESCGKCTGCRLGCRRVEEIFDDVIRHEATSAGDRAEFEEITSALRLTSLCGLGGGAAAFAESVLRHYGPELNPCHG